MKFHEKSRDLEKSLKKKKKIFKIFFFFFPKKIFQNPKNLFYLFFEKKKIFKIFFIFFSLFFLFFLFNLPSFTPPVRATVGEVRYSIEIDVGGE